MSNLGIPLRVNNGKLGRSEDLKRAIDSFIELLLNTSQRSCVSDPRFGFVFNNLKFEIFDEREGIVYNSNDAESLNLSLYEKKISGSSKNLNTFASEFKATIERYEKRLANVTVVMAYIREQKMIYVTVKGIIVKTNANYQYVTGLKIWN